MNTEISITIKKLAESIVSKTNDTTLKKILEKRISCPIDYMRYAEFTSILSFLKLNDHDTILDVSSPQWFSIFLASKYPKTNFYYLNIIDEELDPFKEIASLLGLNNINYIKGDCRNLPFHSGTFDCVISISVIEHIYPEVGGDKKALEEIHRVLKPNSSLLMTVPLKEKRNIIYLNGDVYERKNEKENFFAREYDINMFENLVNSTLFHTKEKQFISEKKGLMSLDYYQWGPGKNTKYGKKLYLYKKKLEYLFKRNLEGDFAKRYLSITDQPKKRLVNISVELRKT